MSAAGDQRSAEHASDAPEFCIDDELGYERSRTQFRAGQGLLMDEVYRYAHLPLIAPAHRAVIAARPSKGYDMGRHQTVYSLVMPLPADALAASENYRKLEGALRASIGHKIAWDLVKRRRSKLHATICGALPVRDEPSLPAEVLEALSRSGPVRVQLRGLFSGNMNIGRLYLRVYPERRRGENAFRSIQRIMRRPETDLYLVGMFNLLDDLSTAEASALATLIGNWWDSPIADLTVHELWLLGSDDDLVLNSEIVAKVALQDPQSVCI